VGGPPGIVVRLRTAAAFVVAISAGASLAAKDAVRGEPPVEYTLSLQQDDFRVRATLRPGEPLPGKLVEILFDIGRQSPTDTVPVADAKLAVSITGPGTRMRLLARPLGDAGIYGVHWTPGARGLWTLALAPYAGEGPSVSFQVGVGVPMPASSQGHAVQASRVVVVAGRTVDAGGAPAVTAKQLMVELGQRWRRAQEPGVDAAAEATAMAALARAAQGRAPKEWTRDAREYDALAVDLANALDKAAALKDRAKVVQALHPLDQAFCLRCHVKFRDGVVADLSSWPEVKPWKR
jgi:hypothetical protein